MARSRWVAGTSLMSVTEKVASGASRNSSHIVGTRWFHPMINTLNCRRSAAMGPTSSTVWASAGRALRELIETGWLLREGRTRPHYRPGALRECREAKAWSSRARSWAERMAGNGDLSHSDLSSLLPPWSAAGENVGVGGSVKGIFGALADSSGHRANMLGDFTHFGIGVWVDSEGRIWTAHVFTR